jgi:hypothetical protein
MAGRKYYRTGLLAMMTFRCITNNSVILFVLLLLMAANMVFPLEDETVPRVLVYSFPDHPVAGSLWTLTLLIDHTDPDEVDVIAPHFESTLFLDQAIKSPRLLNPATGQVFAVNPPEILSEQMTAFERWTVMEYRLMFNSSETVSFGAFTVITPQGQTKTDPFDVEVEESLAGPPGSAEMHHYRLAWEGIPPILKKGENAVFSLRINSGDLPAFPPDSKLFLPPVPPGYILESLPLTQGEKITGIAIRLRLIPLKEGSFILEGRRFSHNGSVFEIPAMRIPVLAATEAKGIPAETNETPVKSGSVPPLLPLKTVAAVYPDLYRKHRAGCESIYNTSGSLWEKGSYAEALAILRQNERDHPAGELFTVIRRGAEKDLGLAGTNDEKKRLINKIRNWLPFLKGESRAAVLREIHLRRIPDTAGEEVYFLKEGQPVLLLPQEIKRNNWLQIITNDNNKIMGWVPKEAIIIY